MFRTVPVISTCHTWDSSRSRSTGDRGRGKRRGDLRGGDLRGEGGDSSGTRRGFSVPPSSLRCSRVLLRGRSAVVSSSPGLSLILDGPGGGGGRSGGKSVVCGGSGGGRGGPGAGVVPSTGSGGGRGEEVRDKGRGEQVRDGGVGVEGLEMEGGGRGCCGAPTALSSLCCLWPPEPGEKKKTHHSSFNTVFPWQLIVVCVCVCGGGGGVSYLCVPRSVQVDGDRGRRG